MKLLLALSLFVLLLPTPASAVEPLPVVRPQGLFVEDDPSASYLGYPRGARATFRRMLNAAIQNNPRNTSALAQRAYLFMEGGDDARAKRDFDAALAAAEPGSPQERHVLWSRGWASYDQANYASTFSDWNRAITLHGGRPFWAAYSLALLYWTTEQPDLALEWYAAAAASDPRWSNAEGVASKTQRWTPQQSERMRALFAAWLQAQAKNSSQGQ